MNETTTTPAPSPLLGAGWSDPLEDEVRGRVRAFIETILEEELSAALGRGRYERTEDAVVGWRNGHRGRHVIGTFGAETVRVPRARLVREDGGTAEWRSKALRRYQRLTKRAEALIAGAYLAGTNTRRVRRALAALFEGAVGKDVVSRTWRRVRTDWEAWNARELHDEDIVRLILDGTVVRAKIDRKATAIALLVAIGVRRDGQKVLLALKNMGGESTAAWTAFLEDMARRGLKAPSFIIVDGAPGLEAALAALWPDIPVQRCTVGPLKKSGTADSIAWRRAAGNGRCWVRRSEDSSSSSSAGRSGTSCPTTTFSPASTRFSISAGCAGRWPSSMPRMSAGRG
jgi:putative transposase